VEVTADSKGEGKLTVRTRTGYFPTVRPVNQAAKAPNYPADTAPK
jgi:hypothetical protein